MRKWYFVLAAAAIISACANDSVEPVGSNEYIRTQLITSCPWVLLPHESVPNLSCLSVKVLENRQSSVTKLPSWLWNGQKVNVADGEFMLPSPLPVGDHSLSAVTCTISGAACDTAGITVVVEAYPQIACWVYKVRPDHSLDNPQDVVVTVANGEEIVSTDVATDGSCKLTLRSRLTGTIEVSARQDAADPDYLPWRLALQPTDLQGQVLPIPLFPRKYAIPCGTFQEQMRIISPHKARIPPDQYGAFFAAEPIALESALRGWDQGPIYYVFVHKPETPIAPHDSAAFAAILEEEEEKFCENELEMGILGQHEREVWVEIDPNLNASGRGGPRQVDEDVVKGGLMQLRAAQDLHSGLLITHEGILHVLARGHTCEWITVQAGRQPGCLSSPRTTVEDVAYHKWGLLLWRTYRQMGIPARHTLRAALCGERKFLLGLSDLGPECR